METLLRVSLFSALALGASAAKESQGISLRRIIRPESVLIKASSVNGVADVKLEYAISDDGVAFGSFDDEADVIASTNTDFATNKEGLHAVDMAAPLAPFIKFKLTELSGTVTDTLVDLTLLLRRSVGG